MKNYKVTYCGNSQDVILTKDVKFYILETSTSMVKMLDESDYVVLAIPSHAFISAEVID